MEVQKLVAKLYNDMMYRPTGVYVIYRNPNDPEFLVAQSARPGHTDWFFPQGGIEEGESLEDNMYRESEEELEHDFHGKLINIKPFIHYGELDAKNGCSFKLRDGFTKGKAYLFSAAEYVGNGHFDANGDELDSYKWVKHAEALKIFQKNRSEKKDMLIAAMELAILYI